MRFRTLILSVTILLETAPSARADNFFGPLFMMLGAGVTVAVCLGVVTTAWFVKKDGRKRIWFLSPVICLLWIFTLWVVAGAIQALL